MKLFILISCCIPVFAFADVTKQNRVQEAYYQELCAKEQDPVKRHNYCYLLEKKMKGNHVVDNIFRKDIAIA